MIDTNATVAGLRCQVEKLTAELDIRLGVQLTLNTPLGNANTQGEIESIKHAIEKKEALIRDYLAYPGERPPGLLLELA